DQDAGDVDLGSADEAAADIHRRRGDEGDGGDAEHGLVEVDGDPLGFSHDVPNTTGIQPASSDPVGLLWSGGPAHNSRYGRWPGPERAGGGAAASGGEPGRAGLPLRRGLRARA